MQVLAVMLEQGLVTKFNATPIVLLSFKFLAFFSLCFVIFY